VYQVQTVQMVQMGLLALLVPPGLLALPAQMAQMAPRV
jgi:hypothetical protein